MEKNYLIIKTIDSLKPNSVDSVISDVRNNVEFALDKHNWIETLRVMKPGSYMLIMSGNIKSHRVCCAVEDAGFEIKDSIMWIYNSKEGRLQPDYCNIIVAKKPTELSIIDNIDLYGVGGINIDECRVEGGSRTMPISSKDTKSDNSIFTELHKNIQRERVPTTQGRFPTNVILTYNDNDEELVCGNFPESSHTDVRSAESIQKFIQRKKNRKGNTQCDVGGNITNLTEYNDSGSASRYFYCAKRSDKDIDYDTPINLLQYLIRMISPKNSNILDICMQNNNIGIATIYEDKERNSDYKYIGVSKIAEENIDMFDYINSLEIQSINDKKEDKKEDIKQLKHKQIKLF